MKTNLKRFVCFAGSLVMAGSFVAGMTFAVEKGVKVIAEGEPTVTEITPYLDPTGDGGDTNYYPQGGATWFSTDVNIPGSANVNFGPVAGVGKYEAGYFRVDGVDFVPSVANKYIRALASSKEGLKRFTFDIDSQLQGDNHMTWDHTRLEIGGLYKSDAGDYIYFKKAINWGYKKAQYNSFFEISEVVNETVTLSGSDNYESTYVSYSGPTDTSVKEWNAKWLSYGAGSYTKYNGKKAAVGIEVVTANLLRIGNDGAQPRNAGDTFEIAGSIARFIPSTSKLHIWTLTAPFSEAYIRAKKDSTTNSLTCAPLVETKLDGTPTYATSGGNCTDSGWAAFNVTSSTAITTNLNGKILDWYSADELALKYPALTFKKNGNNCPNGLMTVVGNSISIGKHNSGQTFATGDILEVKGYAYINHHCLHIDVTVVKDATTGGFINLSTVDTYMNLGYRYDVDGSGKVTNDEFRIKVAVNDIVGSMVANQIWSGVEVTIAGKAVRWNQDKVHKDTENNLYWVMIDLGAAITDGHLFEEITVRGWMKKGDGFGYTNPKTYSIAEMVDVYYAMPEAQAAVAGLYNICHAK